MARGIISCTGETFNIGDKVRTESGEIIRVEGAAIGKIFHNAEKCTKCDQNEPTTKEKNDKKHKAAGVDPVGGSQRGSDCIIWGT